MATTDDESSGGVGIPSESTLSELCREYIEKNTATLEDVTISSVMKDLKRHFSSDVLRPHIPTVKRITLDLLSTAKAKLHSRHPGKDLSVPVSSITGRDDGSNTDSDSGRPGKLSSSRLRRASAAGSSKPNPGRASAKRVAGTGSSEEEVERGSGRGVSGVKRGRTGASAGVVGSPASDSSGSEAISSAAKTPASKQAKRMGASARKPQTPASDSDDEDASKGGKAGSDSDSDGFTTRKAGRMAQLKSGAKGKTGAGAGATKKRMSAPLAKRSKRESSPPLRSDSDSDVHHDTDDDGMAGGASGETCEVDPLAKSLLSPHFSGLGSQHVFGVYEDDETVSARLLYHAILHKSEKREDEHAKFFSLQVLESDEHRAAASSGAGWGGKSTKPPFHVVTTWGRQGSHNPGSQALPFNKQAEAIAKFKSLFADKTGGMDFHECLADINGAIERRVEDCFWPHALSLGTLAAGDPFEGRGGGAATASSLSSDSEAPVRKPKRAVSKPRGGQAATKRTQRAQHTSGRSSARGKAVASSSSSSDSGSASSSDGPSRAASAIARKRRLRGGVKASSSESESHSEKGRVTPPPAPWSADVASARAALSLTHTLTHTSAPDSVTTDDSAATSEAVLALLDCRDIQAAALAFGLSPTDAPLAHMSATQLAKAAAALSCIREELASPSSSAAERAAGRVSDRLTSQSKAFLAVFSPKHSPAAADAEASEPLVVKDTPTFQACSLFGTTVERLRPLFAALREAMKAPQVPLAMRYDTRLLTGSADASELEDISRLAEGTSECSSGAHSDSHTRVDSVIRLTDRVGGSIEDVPGASTRLLWMYEPSLLTFETLRSGVQLNNERWPASGFQLGRGLHFFSSLAGARAHASLFQLTSAAGTVESVASTTTFLLCEVLTGVEHSTARRLVLESLPARCHSVKAQGRYTPATANDAPWPYTHAFKHSLSTLSPVASFGPLLTTLPTAAACELEHDTFVIFDPSQVRPRYVVRVVLA